MKVDPPLTRGSKKRKRQESTDGTIQAKDRQSAGLPTLPIPRDVDISNMRPGELS